MSSLLDHTLTQLHVAHTPCWADDVFVTMPFKSLFGLSKALESFGVDSAAYRLADKSDAGSLALPFLAECGNTFVVVSALDDAGATVWVDGEDRPRQLTRADFNRRFRGTVLLLSASEKACEPDYRKHRLMELGCRAKRWALALAALAAVAYCVIAHGIYSQWSLLAMLAVYGAGLFISYMLILKSHGIKSAAADSICGVVERTGCHTVLTTSAAKFFGLFGWSEVGMTYFGVSAVILLVCPDYAPWLAVINACCCPFSIWSVWYQKTRAKAWCTLCLTVQALLWIGLGVWLLGGEFGHLYPPGWSLVAVLATYVAVLLALTAATKAYDDKKEEQ